MFCSHLPASAGWTGMSTITNGGVMEPTQGLNGSMLASQPGMGATGYPTHWWVGRVGVLLTISLSLAVRWPCGAVKRSPPFVAGLFLGCGTKWGRLTTKEMWVGCDWGRGGGLLTGARALFDPHRYLHPLWKARLATNQGITFLS